MIAEQPQGDPRAVVRVVAEVQHQVGQARARPAGRARRPARRRTARGAGCAARPPRARRPRRRGPGSRRCRPGRGPRSGAPPSTASTTACCSPSASRTTGACARPNDRARSTTRRPADRSAAGPSGAGPGPGRAPPGRRRAPGRPRGRRRRPAAARPRSPGCRRRSRPAAAASAAGRSRPDAGPRPARRSGPASSGTPYSTRRCSTSTGLSRVAGARSRSKSSSPCPRGRRWAARSRTGAKVRRSGSSPQPAMPTASWPAGTPCSRRSRERRRPDRPGPAAGVGQRAGLADQVGEPAAAAGQQHGQAARVGVGEVERGGRVVVEAQQVGLAAVGPAELQREQGLGPLAHQGEVVELGLVGGGEATPAAGGRRRRVPLGAGQLGHAAEASPRHDRVAVRTTQGASGAHRRSHDGRPVFAGSSVSGVLSEPSVRVDPVAPSR